MAENDFDSLWDRYMGRLTPGQYLAAGGTPESVRDDMRDLWQQGGPDDVTDDQANAITAALMIGLKHLRADAWDVADAIVLTTKHAASSYGQPVLLLGEDGPAYGPHDIVSPHGLRAADLVAIWAARFGGRA